MFKFPLILAALLLDPAASPEPVATTLSPAPAPAPQAAPVDIGATSSSRFAFDWDGNHEDGTPGAIVTGVEFTFTTTGTAPIVKRTSQAVVPGTTEIPVKDVLVGVPAGTYDATVKLVGVGGNLSKATPVLAVRVRVKAPGNPTNVRVVGG